MVQHDDAEGARRSVAKSFLRARELRAPDAARLVPPGADRIEPDHVERRRRIGRLRRLPLSLEGLERTREARWKGIGDVVIARNREHGPPEAAEESSGIADLARAAAMAEISARDHQFGLEPVDQNRGPPFDRRIVTCSEMEVGQVQNTCKHSRWRL